MKKMIISVMLILSLLISALPLSVSAAQAETASTGATSTSERYPGTLAETCAKYPDMHSITAVSFPIPGLERTEVDTGSACEPCNNMVPQGICVMDDYILITAYDGIEDYLYNLNQTPYGLILENQEKYAAEMDHHQHNSVIYVVDKTSRQLLKTLTLPDANHVGGIAYDGSYVYVALSKSEKIGVIDPSDIYSAGTTGRVSYKNRAGCKCTASFVTYYDDRLWVGVFTESGSSTLNGFTVSGDSASDVTLTKDCSVPIPAYANGAAFAETGGRVCLAVNCSPGRNSATTTHRYEMDMSGTPSIKSEFTSLTLAPMGEEICFDNGMGYTIFESGATHYSQVTGDECAYITDRVCIASASRWFSWTPRKEDIEGTYDPTNEADGRYVPNYINNGQTMFNPYTAKMLLDMSKGAYDLNNNDPSWKNDLSAKYGYTQFFHNIDGGTYELGSYEEDETYIDDDGEEQVRQVTKERRFNACNATIAFKETTYNEEKRYAIAVAFKGTNIWDYADVLADLDALGNSDGVHSGFAKNAQHFYNQSKSITFSVDGCTVSLYDMIQDMKNPDSPYCMLVTGHSLGAALADVFVGHYLYEDGIDPRNVAAYTFAAPKSVRYDDHRRSNILNFINSDDLVPKIGGNYHIGTNIVYDPDDDFRENYAGSSLLGMRAHSIHNSYTPLVDLMCTVTDGEAFINSYTQYHTNGNVNLGSASLDRRAVGNYDNDLTASRVTFNNASLTIKGDFDVECLWMTNDEDYLLVEGNFSPHYYNSDYEHWWGTFVVHDIRYLDYLTAGTVELKGDFHQYGEYAIGGNSWQERPEKGAHKTVFSGNKTQKVTFDDPDHNSFSNLYLDNTDINFTTRVHQISFIHNMLLPHTEKLIADIIDLNGFDLDYDGDIEAESIINGGSINCHDLTGSVTICEGNLTCSEMIGNISVSDGKVDCDNITGSVSITNGNLNCNNVTGDITMTDVEMSTITENLKASSLIFYNASLTVKGNCDVNSIRMTNAEDYLLVVGDFNSHYYNCDYYHWWGTFSDGTNYLDELIAGTVEIKGDFHQTGEYETGNNSWYERPEIRAHRTILSGSGTQTVTFDDPEHNCFTNLYLENTDINFATRVYHISFIHDMTLQHTEKLIADSIDLNGCNLNYHGDIETGSIVNGQNLSCHDLTCSSVSISDGNLNCHNITGNISIKNGNLNCLDLTGDINLVNGDNHIIRGKLNASSLIFDKANLTVKGNCDINSIRMTNAEDYLLVEGDLCTYYYNADYYHWWGNFDSGTNYMDYLTAGTVEIRGNFHQKGQCGTGGSGSYGRPDVGMHKTILSGSKTQTVTFDDPEHNCFNILCLENNSAEGVQFSSDVYISSLYNHNRNHFTLYNDGEGSSFVDYDGDGIKDNIDAYPLDPDRWEIVPDGYYLVGGMNNWTPDSAFRLTEQEDGFVLENVELTSDSQFKIVYVEGITMTWYPSGMGGSYGENGEITADGTYTVCFRPDGDGGEDWFNGVISVVLETFDPVVPTEAATVAETENTIEHTEVYFLGDVDGDDEVGVIDATYIQRYEAGFNIPISEEDILLRGDVDGDEEVTVIDATYIQRYDAGFNIPYPIGETIS